MICKYYITVNGIKSEIEKSDLKNWNEIKYSLSRLDFSGVVRSFSSKFEFVGYTADMVKEAYETDGLFAKAEIEVQTPNDRWVYSPVFSCPLDFASYEEREGLVRINAIDNSLAAIIKSGKGKKYDYLMSSFTDSAEKPFRYKGIVLDNMSSFRIGNVEEGSNVTSFVPLPGGVYQKLPVTNVNNDIVDGKNISATNQIQEVFTVKTLEELVNAGVVPNDRGFPYGSYTNSDYKFLKSAGNPSGIEQGVRVRVYMDVDMEIPSNINEFEMWVCSATPTGAVVNYPNESNLVGMYKVEKSPNGHYVLDNKHFTLYSDYSLMLLAKISPAGPSTIRVNSCTFYATWEGKIKTSYVDYLKPISLLNRLMASMVDGRSEYTCEIDGMDNSVTPYEYSMIGSWDTDARIANTILVPIDAITNNPGSECYVRTSFSDFCSWMETVFGYIYVIDGTKITFCHRTKVFMDGEPKRVISANDFVYKVNPKVVVSKLEIGYETDKEEAFNMRYEFNRKHTYDTGIVNTEKKMSLLSPYRADSVGFELAFKQGLETSSEDKCSQDGLWCVLAKDSTEEGKSIIVADTDVQMDGASEVKSGMFNYYLSPVYCMKANSRYLSSFFRQLKLTSANVNDIKLLVDCGYISMKRDFTEIGDDCSFFADKMFTIGVLSFSTNDQRTPLDFTLPVSVEWQGKTYIGYIQDVDARYEREDNVDYKLIVKI